MGDCYRSTVLYVGTTDQQLDNGRFAVASVDDETAEVRGFVACDDDGDDSGMGTNSTRRPA